MICHGCGGVVGRDCFNPQECEWITRSMAAEYQAQPDYRSMMQELIQSSDSLLQALNQYNFACEGYRNGSASISEATAAGNDLSNAQSKMFDVIQKYKGV